MRSNGPAGFASFAVKYCLLAAAMVAVTAAIAWLALGMVYGIVLLLVGGTTAVVGCAVGLTGILDRSGEPPGG